MSKVQVLRALVEQRLTAAAEEICALFERTVAEYEEEIDRHRCLLLEPRVKPEINASDVYKPTVSNEEEVSPEQQEWSSSLDQEDPAQPPHIKEEQEEELWTSQEGEQLQGLEDGDSTKFTFTSVPVKSEDHGSNCGESDPNKNLDPDYNLGPVRDERGSDSFDSAANVIDDWEKNSWENQSGVNTVKDNEHYTGERFRCSECGKGFSQNSNLKTHMRIHTGEKPFSCSVCSKRFIQKVHLTYHMARHTGEKLFSCSVCDRKFTWPHQFKLHQCAGESSQRHPTLPQSAANSLKTNKPVSETGSNTKKQFPCSGCGKVFGYKESLLRHMRCHTGEKPFSCPICGRQFRERGNMGQHMVVHTGEKRFSCSVCDQRFCWRAQLKKHKCHGESSSNSSNKSTSEG